MVIAPPAMLPPLLMTSPLPIEAALLPTLIDVANRFPPLASVTTSPVAEPLPILNTAPLLHVEPTPVISTVWLLQPLPTIYEVVAAVATIVPLLIVMELVPTADKVPSVNVPLELTKTGPTNVLDPPSTTLNAPPCLVIWPVPTMLLARMTAPTPAPSNTMPVAKLTTLLTTATPELSW